MVLEAGESWRESQQVLNSRTHGGLFRAGESSLAYSETQGQLALSYGPGTPASVWRADAGYLITPEI